MKNLYKDIIFDTFNKKNKEVVSTNVTHYCAGCGHGVIHKILAESILKLNIKEKTVIAWPVGCSVFGYYYFNLNNIQCPHGRAPSVATGIKRTHEDLIVIVYQGDGDLAGIGMGEIIHAANRGDNISIIFVNNTVYGMTGGQMAPTTLKNQRTLTTQNGRNTIDDGHTINMCKIIDSLEGPVFIERTTISNISGINKTKKAILKALNNQINKVGFSFIEILSPCPTNLKLNSVESRKWMIDNLEKFFEVKNYRDINNINKINDTKNEKLTINSLLQIKNIKSTYKDKRTKNEMNYKIRFSGSGGCGILSASLILINCAKMNNYDVSYIPSYGAEMRGGIVHSDIIISKDKIKSPVIDNPDILVAINKKSLDYFYPTVKDDGIILTNSIFLEKKYNKSKIINIDKITNMSQIDKTIITLSFLIKLIDIFNIKIIKKIITKLFYKNNDIINKNYRLIKQGEVLFNKYNEKRQ